MSLAVPSGVLVAASLGLIWHEGGSIAAAHWLPYGIVVALTVAVILLSGAAAPPRLPALAAVASLAGLAVWTTVSATWAALPSLARDEGLLTLVYALALAVPLLSLRTAGARLAAVVVLVVGLAALTIATALHVHGAGDPRTFYYEGRLAFPISYVNAQAVVFLVGFWPAIALAAGRSAPAAVRVVGFTGAVAMLSGWLLTQSKGGAFGLAVSAAVLFSVVNARLRLLVPTLAAAGFAVAGSVPLTEPFRADGAELAGAIRDAVAVLLWLALAAAVFACAYVLADRRVSISPRVRRLAGIAAVAALLAGAAGGAVAFAVAVDRPREFLADQWDSFQRYPDEETGPTHLLTLGSHRYQYWRVAFDAFLEHPVAGIGARGFGPLYLMEGRTAESPARAHSLIVEVLGETGVVGFVLLLGGVVPPLVIAARRSRDRKLPAVAALGGSAYWLAHASVDWTWTFPALGIPFFLLLGIGAADDRRRRVPGAVATLAGGACVLAAFLALAPPWLSARLTERALAEPTHAARDFRWARRLDPVAVAPLFAEARLARSSREAIPPLERAVAKEPRSVAAHYFLALAYTDAGRLGAARRELREARRLSPSDPFVARAWRAARGEP